MEPTEDKKIQVGESQLSQILEQNKQQAAQIATLLNMVNSLQANQQPATLMRRSRTKERTVVVKFIDGKAVIGYKNRGTETRPKYVYEVPDPLDRNAKLLKIDVILQGMEETPITVDYNEFLRDGEGRKCKVVSEEAKEWVIEQGTVKKTEIDGYTSYETDMIIPVEVIGKTRTFKVQTDDGEELVIDEQFLNIA